jgi:hypothetical protein
MIHNGIQHGNVHIERRKDRYVVRRNPKGEPFDGKSFQAIATAEIVDELTLYVCEAITIFEGGCAAIVEESLDWFIGEGFVYARYKRKGKSKKIKISRLKTMNRRSLSKLLSFDEEGVL